VHHLRRSISNKRYSGFAGLGNLTAGNYETEDEFRAAIKDVRTLTDKPFIGASGLRMIYEMYLQLSGRAKERQLKDPKFGLTHNLGGFPFTNVNAISIIGRYE